MKTWMRGAAGAASRQEADTHVSVESSRASERDIPRIKPLADLVDGVRFQIRIGAVIIANAIVLGVQIIVGVEKGRDSLLAMLNENHLTRVPRGAHRSSYFPWA